VLGGVDALRRGGVVDMQRRPYLGNKTRDERAKLKDVFRCARDTVYISTTPHNSGSEVIHPLYVGRVP
jgi:hypothetical protein